MKKIVLIVSILLITFSCQIDDSYGPQSYLEVMGINSVQVPEQFTFGETHEIRVNYTKPESCYIFYDFTFDVNSNEWVVTVINSVYPNTNCQNANEDVFANFDFTALSNEPYIFKFFKGQDENGVDQYIVVEVPVVE